MYLITIIVCTNFATHFIGNSNELTYFLIIYNFIFNFITSHLCILKTNIFFAGMFWPLQGMPMFLQYVSYCMPFTLPSIAVRNIMMKGYSFFHPSVLIGASIVTGWAFFAVFLGLQGLKRKKYSRNT